MRLIPGQWLRAALAVALTLASVPGLARQGTEMRANWRDLETWSRPAGTGVTEHGLGLHLTGSEGTVMVAFSVRTGGRSATGDVAVQASTGPVTNPNRLQTATLAFSGIDDRKQRFRLDLSSRLTVDNPAPGAQVTSGMARLSASEFERLSGATSVTATVLGLDVAVRPDQLDAMRALAARRVPAPE